VIDEMTIFQVEEIFAYHAEHPPVHLMVAAYLGVKPSTRSERNSSKNGVDEFDANQAAGFLMAAGFGMGNVHAGLGTPTFDVDELMSMKP
jgi:hypothetical protein